MGGKKKHPVPTTIATGHKKKKRKGKKKRVGGGGGGKKEGRGWLDLLFENVLRFLGEKKKKGGGIEKGEKKGPSDPRSLVFPVEKGIPCNVAHNGRNVEKKKEEKKKW